MHCTNDPESNENLSASDNPVTDRPLGPVEKLFLLNAERGDCATVKRIIHDYESKPEEFDINCVDPLNRSALVVGIENENIELVKLLLDANIDVKDALLHAIKEEYVEAVELLLDWEEQHHVPNQPYSWESIDGASSTFTPDITPLILAAHKNNYEIVKLLLDRGATLPLPHDIKCGCDECIELSKADSLRHSQARINAYRALTSPSLIALSSKDPLLTAFELSKALRKLSRMETEFRAEYNDMRVHVQSFSTALLDHVRTSNELEIMLNYDPTGDWDPGDRQSLERLRLAIKYRQKMFVAHPNVQQLLAVIWYEGVPGFRRKTLLLQMVEIVKLMIMFPIHCVIYIIAPASKIAQFMRKPFIKFVCHSASYMFFLTFLSMASQRLEIVVLEILGTEWIREIVNEWKKEERGAFFGLAECVVVIYVISLVWAEIKSLWADGLKDYISDLWNIVDFITNTFYVMWIVLRMCAWYVVRREASQGRNPWYPREQWQSFDPMLLSEGAFAAGMIFSFLKLVHIFSVSPHLGPLQISLGRMIIDIVKFFFIYLLVLFAFGCGLNQLLWYYAELEKNKCYLPNGMADFDNNERACTIWRRYANLFETSQSLFWASFGLVDLVSFELTGIKGFTRFWALLMFGSYSVINVIVLLNMLIAMMSNSYQIISERADVEWKFARSCLWINYFDEGDTLPPPFNIFPTPKIAIRCLKCKHNLKDDMSFKKNSKNKARLRHEKVMRLLVRRYITSEQQKGDVYGVTEDDVKEIRQDVSTLRYELISILRTNGMKTPQVSAEDSQVPGKKDKIMERRILKDFCIGAVEGVLNDAAGSKLSKNLFTHIAQAIKRKSRKSQRKEWNTLVRKRTINQNPIGSSEGAESTEQRRQTLIRMSSIEHDKLLEYNPNLSEVSRATRVAFAKFMTKKMVQEPIREGDEKLLEEDAKGFATDDSLKSCLTTAASVENKNETSVVTTESRNAASIENENETNVVTTESGNAASVENENASSVVTTKSTNAETPVSFNSKSAVSEEPTKKNRRFKPGAYTKDWI